jgi:hypothetical protein
MTLQPCKHGSHSDSESADDQSESIPFPYRFGRIIGVFHAKVLYNIPGLGTASGLTQNQLREPQHIEFLFVRWFTTAAAGTTDQHYRGGWKSRRLHRITFVDGDDDAAFGFLDPQDIIRGVHLIPAFNDGRTVDLLPPSAIARPRSSDHEDWKYFYVNM